MVHRLAWMQFSTARSNSSVMYASPSTCTIVSASAFQRTLDKLVCCSVMSLIKRRIGALLTVVKSVFRCCRSTSRFHFVRQCRLRFPLAGGCCAVVFLSTTFCGLALMRAMVRRVVVCCTLIPFGIGFGARLASKPPRGRKRLIHGRLGATAHLPMHPDDAGYRRQSRRPPTWTRTRRGRRRPRQDGRHHRRARRQSVAKQWRHDRSNRAAVAKGYVHFGAPRFAAKRHVGSNHVVAATAARAPPPQACKPAETCWQTACGILQPTTLRRSHKGDYRWRHHCCGSAVALIVADYTRMATVNALLGEHPGTEAADIDSIFSIWILIAKTIREAGNGIEARLVKGVAMRTDVSAAKTIAASRQVYPRYDGSDTKLP